MEFIVPLKVSSGPLRMISLAMAPPCLMIVIASECSNPSVLLPLISNNSSPAFTMKKDDAIHFIVHIPHPESAIFFH